MVHLICNQCSLKSSHILLRKYSDFSLCNRESDKAIECMKRLKKLSMMLVGTLVLTPISVFSLLRSITLCLCSSFFSGDNSDGHHKFLIILLESGIFFLRTVPDSHFTPIIAKIYLYCKCKLTQSTPLHGLENQKLTNCLLLLAGPWDRSAVGSTGHLYPSVFLLLPKRT